MSRRILLALIVFPWSVAAQPGAGVPGGAVAVEESDASVTHALESLGSEQHATACARALERRPIDLSACNAALDDPVLSREERVSVLNNRALGWQGVGEVERAMVDLNSANAIAPDDHRVLQNRANLLVRMQRFNEAVEDYDGALALTEGRYAPAYYGRGMARLGLGDFDAAMGDFETARRLTP